MLRELIEDDEKGKMVVNSQYSDTLGRPDALCSSGKEWPTWRPVAGCTCILIYNYDFTLNYCTQYYERQ